MPQGEQVGTAERVIEALAAALPGVVVVGEPRRLPRGYASEAWRLPTTAGELLVKIAIRSPQGERLPNAAEATRLAARQGVPTPQALAIAEPWPAFGGKAYSVWEYLDGLDSDEALAGMDEGAATEFFGQLGALLARLHQAPRPHFSRTVVARQGHPSWVEAVLERLRQLEDRYRDCGLEVDDLVADAVARIADLASAVSPQCRPVLVHGDLYPDNLIVAPDGSPVLLDFEHASFADAGYEFVKPTLFIFGRHPAARTALLRGYQAQGDPDELDRRIHVALGLELVWGLPFFYRWNDHDVVALYRSQLSRWLTATSDG